MLSSVWGSIEGVEQPNVTKTKSKMSTPKELPSAGLPKAHGQGEKPQAAAGGAVRRAAGRPGGQRTGQSHRGEQPRAKGPATGMAPSRGARATNRNGKRGGGTDDAHGDLEQHHKHGAAAQREAGSRGERDRALKVCQ